MTRYHMNLLAAKLSKIEELNVCKEKAPGNKFKYGVTHGNSRMVGSRKKRRITGKKK